MHKNQSQGRPTFIINQRLFQPLVCCAGTDVVDRQGKLRENLVTDFTFSVGALLGEVPRMACVVDVTAQGATVSKTGMANETFPRVIVSYSDDFELPLGTWTGTRTGTAGAAHDADATAAAADAADAADATAAAAVAAAAAAAVPGAPHSSSLPFPTTPMNTLYQSKRIAFDSFAEPVGYLSI